jgi:hypothetical protein
LPTYTPVPIPTVVEPEPVLAEDVFEDIFRNAAKVDRISIDDIENCRIESEYEVQLGDVVSVEVALARKEDVLGGRLSQFFRPQTHYIRDTSGDGVLGNDVVPASKEFFMTSRTIGNQWNEVNTGPYVIAVYRGSAEFLDGDEDLPVGVWSPSFGALVPGTYSVSLVSDQNSPSLCKDMQTRLGRDLIPDSVLIAWYVH